MKLKHYQEPKNRGLIADSEPPKKRVPAWAFALSQIVTENQIKGLKIIG
jgi:hypothetical protein